MVMEAATISSRESIFMTSKIANLWETLGGHSSGLELISSRKSHWRRMERLVHILEPLEGTPEHL